MRRYLTQMESGRIGQGFGDSVPSRQHLGERERGFDGALHWMQRELEVTPSAGRTALAPGGISKGKRRARSGSVSRPARPRAVSRRARPGRSRHPVWAEAPVAPRNWKRWKTSSTCQRKRSHPKTRSAGKAAAGDVVNTMTYLGDREQ